MISLQKPCVFTKFVVVVVIIIVALVIVVIVVLVGFGVVTDCLTVFVVRVVTDCFCCYCC